MQSTSRSGASETSSERVKNKRLLLSDLLFFGFLLSLLYVTSSKAPTQETRTQGSMGQTNISTSLSQPRWREGQPFLLHVFISPAEVFIPEQNTPLWTEELTYGFNLTNHRQKTFRIPVDSSILKENKTVYCYAIAKKLSSTSEEDEEPILFARTPLIVFKEKKVTVGRSLIKGEETSAAPQNVTTSGIYWKPFTSISVVVDFTPYDLQKIPPLIAEKLILIKNGTEYLPVFDFEEFWLLSSNLVPLNETVKEVSLDISFRPLSLMKWSTFVQLDSSWKTQNGLGMNTAEETEELKRMLLETNPYFLGITAAVTVLHTVFEFLAFKNDVSHWRNAKSMEGVSVRSMIWKLGMEVVILLYLLDNETSWMIVMSSFLGLGLEAWKLTKAFRIKDFGKVKLFGVIPFFRVKNRKSYAKTTKELDDQAMKYLSFIIYPLVAGYSIYSLIYETHKSWYSWILSSLVGAVYAFGFIMMLPQIFINYKLKSVAHLPMKALMYKFLNTIIDDLFAFVIKMPTLHRLACFRDDVVFLIFLYQRWIYPVDTSRVNEFGQVFTSDDDKKKQ
eukprot:jgi/Galph1/3363/GphlegSOOS_G2036.1